MIIKGIVLHLYAQFAYRTLLLYILTAVLVRFLALDVSLEMFTFLVFIYTRWPDILLEAIIQKETFVNGAILIPKNILINRTTEPSLIILNKYSGFHSWSSCAYSLIVMFKLVSFCHRSILLIDRTKQNINVLIFKSLKNILNEIHVSV